MKRPILLLTLTTLCLVGLMGHQVNAGQEQELYLPLILSPTLDCNVPGASYDTFPVIPPPTDRPAAQHGDLNLALRNYEPTTAALQLVEYGGGTDAKAPQLDTLFADHRVPTFRRAYQVHHWDWTCNCRADTITDPTVTHLGLGVSRGEIIYAPDSGYDIGGGNDALILYASKSRLTLKYTGEDNVAQGYTIHLENICVEPDLLALYRVQNQAGRAELPAVAGGQALGRALGNQIGVSVRDNGTFLDPRSRKDWWQNH